MEKTLDTDTPISPSPFPMEDDTHTCVSNEDNLVDENQQDQGQVCPPFGPSFVQSTIGQIQTLQFTFSDYMNAVLSASSHCLQVTPDAWATDDDSEPSLGCLSDVITVSPTFNPFGAKI